MSNLRADPCVLVIFGASGDLTRRKLLPAVFNLAEGGNLPDAFAILGVARPRIDQDTYRAQMREQVRAVEGEPLEPDKWKRIEERLYYVSGEFNDPALYDHLKAKLAEIRARHHTPPNYLFYFAIPPDLFGTVGDHLAQAGLTKEDDGWRRLIVEKPFGYDLESARALNAELRKGLHEPQIYRIDHYLGKETVQNILAFRFANGIFEPIWNRRYVDHIQMTVAEQGGVEHRGAYYDKAGALRDIVQNHMFQVMTLIAMEPPISFRAEDVRDEKVKVLHAVAPLTSPDVRHHVVRAQYTAPGSAVASATAAAARRREGARSAGARSAGASAPAIGYTQEPNVNPDSRTETFAAMRLFVDNWRWAGIPFYLRTGKRLPRRVTEVAVQFKCPPLLLFRETSVGSLSPNVLVIRIQPDEGISLCFEAKVPGPFVRLETVTMDFGYTEYFKTEPTTGYETLLFDAMAGDQTLFHRMDMVEAGWQVVAPILDAWKNDTSSSLPTYEAETWGPAEADLLLERDRRQWRT